MVVRISTGKSIQKILNYNEHKVAEGNATLLVATGFPKDAPDMSFYDKLAHFKMLTSRNRMASTNAFHVSLNFDPSEKLSDGLMVEIAGEYMDRIGFRHQPYLVYRHEDARHPHLHICSTNIRLDGSRISTHNLGRDQSEKARRELQEEYGLVEADGRRLSVAMDGPAGARKVEYGKVPTKEAIGAVLRHVLDQYRLTSLAELNAVLKNYNVVAETGAEGSRLKSFRGVIYGALDDSGQRVGAPVKASAFWFKPTLPSLEKRFGDGKVKRQPYRQRLVTAIDWAMLGKGMTLDRLVRALQQEQVQLVVRKGKDDRIYGLTYIDHRTKSVFNGSDLGRPYSAAGMLERLQTGQQPEVIPSLQARRPVDSAIQGEIKQKSESSQVLSKEGPFVPGAHINGGLENLIGHTRESGYVPFELSAAGRRKKKKKGKRL